MKLLIIFFLAINTPLMATNLADNEIMVVNQIVVPSPQEQTEPLQETTKKQKSPRPDPLGEFELESPVSEKHGPNSNNERMNQQELKWPPP